MHLMRLLSTHRIAMASQLFCFGETQHTQHTSSCAHPSKPLRSSQFMVLVISALRAAAVATALLHRVQ